MGGILRNVSLEALFLTSHRLEVSMYALFWILAVLFLLIVLFMEYVQPIANALQGGAY